MAEKQFDDVKINVEFSEEQELKELTSGEKLSVLMGKLAKAVKDIISHIADGVKHISAEDRENWNGKANGTHGHSAGEISGLPSSLPANGGNADTVDGLHAWEHGTLDAEGNFHGAAHPFICQYNLFGDGRFGFQANSVKHETRTHYATGADHAVNSDHAGNADTLQNQGFSDGKGGRGIVYIPNDNAPMEIGPYIDFHALSREGTDFSTRLQSDPSGTLSVIDGINNNTATVLCNILGDAGTVNGSHAWQTQTLNSEGGTHGSGSCLLYCRHNVFGDDRFGLIIDSGHQTRCHYASGADNADMLDGLHADSFAAASHGHAEASQSAAGFLSAEDKTKLDKIVQYFTNNGQITF